MVKEVLGNPNLKGRPTVQRDRMGKVALQKQATGELRRSEGNKDEEPKVDQG